MLKPLCVLFLGAASLATALPPSQVVFGPASEAPSPHDSFDFQNAVAAALAKYSDPVEAMISLNIESKAQLYEPRLLHVLGEDKPTWLTEGDKLRLRKEGKKFIDITEHEDYYAGQVNALAGKANLPDLVHESLVRPLFSKVDTQRLRDVLTHLTSYYNRYYGYVFGSKALNGSTIISQKYIIAKSPFRTHISLEYFTHPFPQSSIIARFEPKVRNASAPLTIIGAHQDSANYLFPLLPAPGADDDGSGTVSILEAFRILAESGYTPKDGPVEFHWYAAEEGGLLGSQRIARYKKDQGAKIGAMMEFDMTGYVARNATETIGFIATQADDALTNWVLNLAKKYIAIPAKVYELGPSAGSDYMSYTLLNYPAAFASEGNPLANKGFPGEYDPYIHGSHDIIDIDDEKGYFSFDHMARFTELALAFVVEQAGWDNKWR